MESPAAAQKHLEIPPSLTQETKDSASVSESVAILSSTEETLFSTFQEAVITGLLPETTYSISVAAYTTKGDGARSKARLVTTTGAGLFLQTF